MSSRDVVQVVVRSDAPVPVIASPPDAVKLVVTAVGVPGPPGIEPYVHVQSSASDMWIINHNRGVALGAQAFTVGGAEIEAEVVAVSSNQTRIYFVVPIAGTARLS